MSYPVVHLLVPHFTRSLVMVQGSQGSTIFENDEGECILTSIERFNLREGHFKEDGSCVLEFDARPTTPEPHEQHTALRTSGPIPVDARASGASPLRACEGSWRVAEAAMIYHITAALREEEDADVMAWRVKMRRFKAPTLEMVLTAQETQQRLIEEQQRVFEQEQLRMEMFRAAEEAAQQIAMERERAAEEGERHAMAAEEGDRLAMAEQRELQEAQQRLIEEQQRVVEIEKRRLAMEQRRAFEHEERRLARERQMALEMKRHLAMMQQRAAEEAAQRLAIESQQAEEAALLAEAAQVPEMKRKKPRGCRSGKLVKMRREFRMAQQDSGEANQG